MNINFNLKNVLKKTREQYVKEFKASGELKIEPCDKFVACLEKLSKNYVLALKDRATAETLQIANQNDMEFFEGYELTPNFTDDLRRQLSEKSAKIYHLLTNIISMFNELEKDATSKTKSILNDIKLDLNVIKSIVLNIYQHLTMTNDIPIYNAESQDFSELLSKIKDTIIDLVKEIIELSSRILIDYISRQLDIVVEKLLNYYNRLENIKK